MKSCLLPGLLVGLWLLTWPALAQTPAVAPASASKSFPYTRDADLTQLLQNLFPVQIEGIDYPAVFDALAQLYASPIDLNTATRDDLAATYLLDERQLSNLLDYRARLGRFLSIYELQAVPDLDVVTIRRLLPFVTVEADPRLFGNLPTPTDNYLLVRYQQVLEQRKGYSAAEPDKKGNQPTRYLGDPQQWFARYRYSRTRQFSIGFSAGRDAGEQWAWNLPAQRYGADFVSFHAQLQNRGRWRNILVGDYQMQVGQGLVLSAGFVLGKNAETVQTVRRPTLGARPYTSQTESGFFRGLTATYAITPKLDLTLMASRLRRDANTTPGSSTLVADDDIATSLQTSGLHRTPSELADRNSIREQNLAAHLLFQPNRNVQLGATVLHTTFDLSYERAARTYNQYEFVGKQNVVVGLHGGYVRRNLNLFGEMARSSGSDLNSGGIGAVGGLLASLTKRLDLAVVLRHYDRNFHSFYSNAFSESTRNTNETGVYAGTKYSIYRKLTVSGYVDLYQFSWWKYLVDGPSSGFDVLGQVTYTPNRRTTFYAIYHEEHKGKNDPDSKLSPKPVVETVRRSVALNAEFSPVPGLTLRSRIQSGTFGYLGNGPGSASPSRGIALVQDATWERGRWSLSGRVAFFGTDDYDSRQYVYERDVLYAFSFPAYYNRGFRHYLLVQYAANRHLDLWVRWARTDLLAPKTIGSDLDLIDAPHRSEVKVQVRWRF